MGEEKRRMKKLLFHLTLVLCLLTACKSSIPGEYIQPSEMEAVLYDYHQTLAVMTEQKARVRGSGKMLNFWL